MMEFIKHLVWSTQRNFLDWKKEDKKYIFKHGDMKVTVSNDIENETYTISSVITVSTKKQIKYIDMEYKSIKELFELLDE